MIYVTSNIEVMVKGSSDIVLGEFISIFKSIYSRSKEDALDVMFEIKNFLQEELEDGTIKS